MSYRPRDASRHPPAHAPSYLSSFLRAPRHAPLTLPQGPLDLWAPAFAGALGPDDHDLTVNAAQGGAPLGERIVLHGRVIDEDGRPQAGTLVEIWQANAGGRYRHRADGHVAPIDPHFGGCGRCLTDTEGRYRFTTIRPGAYPFPNGPNAWRPAHIHLSLFGHAFAQRLVTQMYFEGDPMIATCPIVASLPDADAVGALCARLDMEATIPFEAVAWRFDVVLRGRAQTPFETRLEGL
ncbi:MAG: protocatechuate 3,4-dioxygenase subunit beta [Shimia sp.]